VSHVSERRGLCICRYLNLRDRPILQERLAIAEMSQDVITAVIDFLSVPQPYSRSRDPYLDLRLLYILHFKTSNETYPHDNHNSHLCQRSNRHPTRHLPLRSVHHHHHPHHHHTSKQDGDQTLHVQLQRYASFLSLSPCLFPPFPFPFFRRTTDKAPLPVERWWWWGQGGGWGGRVCPQLADGFPQSTRSP